jgi:hypothetical protein
VGNQAFNLVDCVYSHHRLVTSFIKDSMFIRPLDKGANNTKEDVSDKSKEISR